MESEGNEVMQLFKNLFYLGILRDWLQFLKRLFTPVVNTFIPPKFFSWQTLFWLSVFSGVVSLLIVNAWISSFVGQVGWIFLTLSIVWATQPLKLTFLGWTFRPGSWIGAAFICWLLYFWNYTSFAFALILWPMVAAVISTIPRFLNLDRGQVFKLPNVAHRQKLITLYLTCAVLSCWITFHFVVQSWLARYPSLVLDDFSRSAFVVAVGQRFAEGLSPNSAGVRLLAIAEQQLVQQLNDQPWTDTERWLMQQQQQEFAGFREQVQMEFRRQLRPTPGQLRAPFWRRSPTDVPIQEQELWQFLTPQVINLNNANDYRISVIGLWLGPSSRTGSFQLRQQCRIAEVQPRLPLPSPGDFFPQELPRPQDFLSGQVSPQDLLPNPETLFPDPTPQPRLPVTTVGCEPVQVYPPM
jgi:hypothetical protein